MNQETWDVPTRVLHWGLAIVITLQLATGLVVATPGTRLYFYLHEYIGLAAALIVLLHWLSSYANLDLPLMFPWRGEGWQTVKAETRDFLRGKLPVGGRCAGLSSFIHGLGLLAVTAIALTGFLIYLALPEGRGAFSDSANYHGFTVLSEIHSFIAWFVWIYWIAHVATALLHVRQRDGVFTEMFVGLEQRDSRKET